MTPLQKLLTMPEYRAQRAHVFQSDESLRWFLRQNRDALINAGAVVQLGRRCMVEPERFDAKAFEIGRQAAQRAGGDK